MMNKLVWFQLAQVVCGATAWNDQKVKSQGYTRTKGDLQVCRRHYSRPPQVEYISSFKIFISTSTCSLCTRFGSQNCNTHTASHKTQNHMDTREHVPIKLNSGLPKQTKVKIPSEIQNLSQETMRNDSEESSHNATFNTQETRTVFKTVHQQL